MKAINFGCGLNVESNWVNYDASPTLRLQRLPLIGKVARVLVKPCFPDLASYGDIVRGLPLSPQSADLVYCSHVLEHLSLLDFRRAVVEVLRILKPGGVFRGVLPDLEAEARTYLNDAADDACSRFMQRTYLGLSGRPRGLSGLLRSSIGNSQHLWMWDFKGLRSELRGAGFVDIRRALCGDSRDSRFKSVEDPSRWEGALGYECVKPESR